MTMLSYMLTIWDIILWVLRAAIAITYTMGIDFAIVPLNLTIEIIVLFLTIPAMIFVVKRNVIGAACYMAVYVSYFGTAIYNTVNNVVSEDGLTIGNSFDLLISIMCVVIPVLTFLDVLLNKHRKSILGKQRGNDWFYDNKDFDRNLDDRADKNQYKIR